MSDSSDSASAKARIEAVSNSIRRMSQDLADEAAPRPTWLHHLSEATREAPIQSLALAFLIGIMLARR